MKRLPIIVGLIAYVIFCVAAWEIYRGAVEDKLEGKAAEALVHARATNPEAGAAEIDYEGMLGTLRGVADPEIAAKLRHEIDRSVGWGALEVADVSEPLQMPKLVVPDRPSDPKLPESDPGRARFAMRSGANPETLVMWGRLPDDKLIDELVLATRRKTDVVRWVDAERLRRAEVEPESWLEGLPALVRTMVTHSDRVTLQVDPTGFVVGGDVFQAAGEAQILKEAKALAAGEVIDRLRVPGTVEISRNGEGLLEVRGQLGSKAEVKAFAEALAQGAPGVDVDFKIDEAPDVYCPGWMLGVAGSLSELVGDREAGSVRIGDGKLVLGGFVDGKEAKQELLDLAGLAAGEILEIEDGIDISQSALLTILKYHDDISVEGRLPNEEMAGKLVAAIQNRFPLAIGIDRSGLAVSEGVGGPKWFTRAVSMIPDFLEAIDEGGVLEISDSGVVLQAGVRSEAAKKAVLDRANAIAGGELTLDNQGIMVLMAPELSVSMSGEKVSLSGILPNEEMRDALTKNILGLLSAVEIEDEIVFEDAVWDPLWFPTAVDAIPEFLQIASAMGEAEVVIDAKQVTATTKLPSDEMREPVELLFSGIGRAGLKVDLKLSVLSQARLIIARIDGKTKLSGRLKDPETRAKFLALVADAFPDAELEEKIVIDEDVAESGWDTMVLDLVSMVFDEVNDPGVDLRPGKVRIEGQIESESALEDFEKTLHDDFGAAFDLEIAIRVPEKLVAEPRFELALFEGKWTVDGMVATAEEKRNLLKAVDSVRGTTKLVDRLEVTPDVSGSPWAAEVQPLVEAVASAKEPWVLIFRGVAQVDGEFKDDGGKKRLVEAGSGLSGIKFEDWTSVAGVAPSIVVPPPPGEDPAPKEGGDR